MSDTRLREAERRWRQSGAPEDEVVWLTERARAGHPLPCAEPRPALLDTMLELAALYAADRAGFVVRLRRELQRAGPVWTGYWAHLTQALDPDGPFRRQALANPRSNYALAYELAALATPFGQPLAKAILRDLAPRYWDLSLAEGRIVRVLGASLDPDHDEDALSLLLDLLGPAWEIDDKSRRQFLEAALRAGLERCRPHLDAWLGSFSEAQQEDLQRLIDHVAAAGPPLPDRIWFALARTEPPAPPGSLAHTLLGALAEVDALHCALDDLLQAPELGGRLSRDLALIVLADAARVGFLPAQQALWGLGRVDID
ncbi:MAG: hypothetical protein AB7N76_25680 [Planctomycetota bacterium]